VKKRGKRHSPEQIVKKLRDADVMLNSGKDLAAVLQTLEVSEATSTAGEPSLAA
jgi:type III secretion system FlhB-like substrate exporter